ncbi:MAG: glycosyl-4,4'-diaponeurosporenoate acyltransferase [Candidatus Hydrogenedentes bacterium]|nr:glycosyl-4,4'-diaponeurosporenoate acyltransferase [Candidatus Hydrogenedentota bacterium]
MLIELPVLWLVIVNVAAWPAIHMAAAWAGTQLPVAWFNPAQWLYRERALERGGRLYERVFAIRRWKRRLPDGAALFKKGFRKKRLQTTERDYLLRFVQETCRGEAVHWAVLACSTLFFLWNPWWVGLIMVSYAILANVPCIFAQRFNRIRLARMAASKA